MAGDEHPTGSAGRHDRRAAERQRRAGARPIDQIIADTISPGAPYRSLEVGVTPATPNGNPDSLHTVSHKGPNARNNPEFDPKALFTRLFMGGSTTTPPPPDQATKLANCRKSVLDAVLHGRREPAARLGSADKARVEQHLEAIRSIEKRLLTSTTAPPVQPAMCTSPTAPTVGKDTRSEAPPAVNTAMAELSALALACEKTRVLSFMFSLPAAHVYYRHLAANMNDDFHDIICHGDAGDQSNQPRVDTGVLYAMKCLNEFLTKLKNTPRGAAHLARLDAGVRHLRHRLGQGSHQDRMAGAVRGQGKRQAGRRPARQLPRRQPEQGAADGRPAHGLAQDRLRPRRRPRHGAADGLRRLSAGAGAMCALFCAQTARSATVLGMNRTALVAAAAAVVSIGAACTQTIDAGSNRPHGRLPVDERNPVVLTNDGIDDNWQGEYAVLLANSGTLKLDAIIVSTSPGWADIEANISGWRALVDAARMSGLRHIPDPIASTGPPLTRPADGAIDRTPPNRSEGAHRILEASHRLGLPYRPLVVLTGGRLTDVADAYLIDPTVTDRVVVVSALGTTTASGGAMGIPNGEMDPWAEMIVAARFRYVQVSAYYDQLTDVPASRVDDLPPMPSAPGSRPNKRRSGACRWRPIRWRSRRFACRTSRSPSIGYRPPASSGRERRRDLICSPTRRGAAGSSRRAWEPSRRIDSGSCSAIRRPPRESHAAGSAGRLGRGGGICRDHAIRTFGEWQGHRRAAGLRSRARLSTRRGFRSDRRRTARIQPVSRGRLAANRRSYRARPGDLSKDDSSG